MKSKPEIVEKSSFRRIFNLSNVTSSIHAKVIVRWTQTVFNSVCGSEEVTVIAGHGLMVLGF